ncbi:MAG: amidohydrolase [Spirochaetaceae bacterium]|jgi:predicted amidohydrolase YtcJ|nr:amidohydrolase [Spirochaetaceae bacterium]
MVTSVRNARVYVERGRFAEALLIEDGLIRVVGTNREVDDVSPIGARVIDAQGALVLPGFYDSHLHAAHAGHRLHEIQVRGVTSIEDLIQRARSELRRLDSAPGASAEGPVQGTGWNQDEFDGPVRRFPDRRDLDRITAERPLILSRVCGHTVSCNTRALEDAGIDRNFPDPEGGGIERDAGGAPTGVFHGSATRIIRGLIRPYTDAQVKAQITHTLGRASAFGITSIGSHDVFGDNGPQIVAIYNDIFASGAARVRVSLQCNFCTRRQLRDFYDRGWVTGASLGHQFITMGPLKLFADGSLGSRTAYLLEPYTDEPDSRGYRDMDGQKMNRIVREADSLGYQVVTHAIGDGGVDMAVTSFEGVTGPRRNPKRHGVVHCEVASRTLLERMAARNIIALVQPVFLTHDLHVAVARLGPERAAYCHAFATMKGLGIPLAFGTDHPVESLNPLDCIRCAVLRQDLPGDEPPGGFFPAERLDTADAVDAYTWGSAFYSREEGIKGRLRPGFFADLTALDRDIFQIPPQDINKAGVVFTMTGGEFSFQQ